MSAATLAALEQAIFAHLADELPGRTTRDWVLIGGTASGVEEDGVGQIAFESNRETSKAVVVELLARTAAEIAHKISFPDPIDSAIA